MLDNGTVLQYPQYLKFSEDKLKVLQRRLAHKKKGSKRWKQICFSLSRLHIHISRQRDDWQSKQIHNILAKCDALVLEKLNIRVMLSNHRVAKSIFDASWGKFAKKAIHKAEMMGKIFIAVDPWGTTQFCHKCLSWVPKDLSERTHACPTCGITIPRDLNSSLLIKRLGLQSYPPSDGGLSLAEPRPLPSLRGCASRGCEAGSH